MNDRFRPNDGIERLVQVPYNKALLSDKFSAALQICRRARRYMLYEKGQYETQII